MLHVWSPGSAGAKYIRPSGDALFSYGFRPFFLVAALYASLLMSVWLFWITSSAGGSGGQWLSVAGGPFSWHAHEMLYGYAAAVIAGFLLTAVPNWTGALPISGAPLIGLVATWAAGRAVMALSGILPALPVALIDCAFLPLLGAFAARQLVVKPAPRNLVFLGILAVLTLCNIFYHLALSSNLASDPQAAMRNALLVVVVMMAIIGGRIIPAFTHNWLHLNQGAVAMPRRVGWLDIAAVASIAAVVVLQILAAPSSILGSAALFSALANALRLALWRGWAARPAPIVWVLHVAYAWIVAGLALTAASAFSAAVPVPLASHAFATGAIGTMTLAVMSRASLGHTGRPLAAPRAIVAAYLLVTLSALLRVAGPLLLPSIMQMSTLAAAAIAWIAAFGLFVGVYAPILTTPRVHTKIESR